MISFWLIVASTNLLAFFLWIFVTVLWSRSFDQAEELRRQVERLDQVQRTLFDLEDQMHDLVHDQAELRAKVSVAETFRPGSDRTYRYDGPHFDALPEGGDA